MGKKTNNKIETGSDDFKTPPPGIEPGSFDNHSLHLTGFMGEQTRS